MVSLGISFSQLQLSPAHWNLRVVLGAGALLSALLLWLYVDLLHEQVRRAETVRAAFAPLASQAGTSALNLVDARPTGPLPSAAHAAGASPDSALRVFP